LCVIPFSLIRTASTIPSQLPVFGHPNNKLEGVQTFEVMMQVSAASCYFLFLIQIFFSKPSQLTYTYVLQQAQFASSLLGLSFTLKMEAERFSGTLSNFYKTKWRHIPEGGTLHNFDLLQLFWGHSFP
jgi:hypothetical protein